MARAPKSEMIRTKKLLAEDMKKYVAIILEEYKDIIPHERQLFLNSIINFENNVSIVNSGTISMFATANGVLMPMGAYKVFQIIKNIPGYGVNKNHKSYQEGEILNDNTYYDYIKHVYISGMSVEDFFRDTLLHETMHFCGAGGSSFLREGFTELKTRELAQKYGLRASRCGYPKEVGIAYRLQKMFGKTIADSITFADSQEEIKGILLNSYGEKITNLYFEIEAMMNASARKVYDHSKFGGIFGPIKKAKAYSKIDYTDVYEKLKEMERLFNNNNRHVPKKDEKDKNSEER